MLALTTFDLDEYVFEALRAGASGFLLKDAPAEELTSAIHVLARGDALLAPAVTRRIVEAFVARSDPEPADVPELDDLSPREVEVLRLLAAGRSNAQIAGELIVSDATVKTHVSNILAKLRLRDRIHAVIYAYETGARAAREQPAGAPRVIRALTGPGRAAVASRHAIRHGRGPRRRRRRAVSRARAGRARLRGHRLREQRRASAARRAATACADRAPTGATTCRPSTASASSRASTATCPTR